MNKEVRFKKTSGNIFKDLGFSDEEARNLQFRSYLMNALKAYIQHFEMTQKDAAKKLGVTQPRISNLVHGRIDLFSIGMLLDMIEKTGFKIYEKIEDDIEREFISSQWMPIFSKNKSPNNKRVIAQ